MSKASYSTMSPVPLNEDDHGACPVLHKRRNREGPIFGMTIKPTGRDGKNSSGNGDGQDGGCRESRRDEGYDSSGHGRGMHDGLNDGNLRAFQRIYS